VTSVIGLTVLPHGLVFTMISLQLLPLLGVGKVPSVAGASTSPALNLCAASFSVLEGTNPSTISSPSFYMV
jgi:hypothetical protein